jgi:hypothetical protein
MGSIMVLIAIALLQAAVPAAADATAEPAAAATAEQAENAAASEPAGPKMKRVCRMKIDPRVGTLASRQRVCEYVRADRDSSPK